MSNVYLSLGSNLGDRKRNLENAIGEIGRRCGEIDISSSFYVTTPWGFSSPNDFINSVILVITTLEPAALLAILKDIELNAGRQAKTKTEYQDRPVDIDILFYDDRVVATEQLTIPHPRLHLRLFVLIPLVEIAPQIIHPVFQKTVTDLLRNCPDHSAVLPF
jgi:2-amino-4-hydroxy-6-hydroxymethyldihydropteridine diphosphokinase